MRGNGVESDQITDPFCTDEPGAGFQYFIEKESVSTLSGTDGSDAVSGGRRSLLRRCVRQTDPHDQEYIKRGISAGGCADLLATSLFLAMLCNKIPNENGTVLNLFQL